VVANQKMKGKILQLAIRSRFNLFIVLPDWATAMRRPRN
jgi:hypothetical protein